MADDDDATLLLSLLLSCCMKLAIWVCAFSEMWMLAPPVADFSTLTLTSFKVGSWVLAADLQGDDPDLAGAGSSFCLTFHSAPILFSANTSPMWRLGTGVVRPLSPDFFPSSWIVSWTWLV